MFDDSILDPSLDWDAQQQQIEQQQARIAALRKIGDAGPQLAQQQPGWTSAVTGAHMLAAAPHTSLLQAITPIASSFLADRGDQRVAQATSDLTSAEQQQVQDVMGNLPKGTPAQQAQPAIPGTAATPDSYGPSGGDASSTLTTMTPGAPGTAGTPATPFKPAVPASQADIMTALSPLMKNPLGRSLAMKKMEDMAINEPERQAQREQAAATAAAAQAQKHEEFLQRQQDTATNLAAGRENTRAIAEGQHNATIEAARLRAEVAGGKMKSTPDGRGRIILTPVNGGPGQIATYDDGVTPIPGPISPQNQKIINDQETQKKVAQRGLAFLDQYDKLLAEEPPPGSYIGEKWAQAKSLAGLDTPAMKLAKQEAEAIKLDASLMMQSGLRSNKNLEAHNAMVGPLAESNQSVADRQRLSANLRKNFEYMTRDDAYVDPLAVQTKAVDANNKANPQTKPSLPRAQALSGAASTLPKAPDGRPVVSSDADFALLPKGTKFVDKDGKGWTK
jgi:hypothetical protein